VISQVIRLLLFTILFLSVSSILFSSSLFAEGFRILDHGAAATGQGAAFSAQADDPSALHYNPAGMTQLKGIQFSAGTLLIGGSIEFKSAQGPNVDGDLGGSIANPPPSTLFLTAHLPALGLKNLPNWTVGIGVTSPFALQVEYPDDSLIAPISTQASLPLIDIKPTLAYKLNNYISIGGGLDIYTFASFLGEGHAELQQNAAPGNPFGIPAGTGLEANGKDTALGFNASMLWTPLRNAAEKPILNLGFVYRNGANLNLDGDFLANGAKVADASTTIELQDGLSGMPNMNGRLKWMWSMRIGPTLKISICNFLISKIQTSHLAFARRFLSPATTEMPGSSWWELNLKSSPLLPCPNGTSLLEQGIYAPKLPFPVETLIHQTQMPTLTPFQQA
jgi:long-chain fatty acid transport protein